MECLSSRREREAPGGRGRAKIENSSRRHPRKFGQKRFLAVRRSWRGNGVASLWATSLEKIFGGELRRLHHRQIGGLFTFEDATSIDAGQPVQRAATRQRRSVPRRVFPRPSLRQTVCARTSGARLVCVLINAGMGRMSAIGENRTRRDGGNDVNDPTETLAAKFAVMQLLLDHDESVGR